MKVIEEVTVGEGVMRVVIDGVAVPDPTAVSTELAEPVTMTVCVCKEEAEIVAREEAVKESDAEVEVVTEGLAVGVAVTDGVTLSLVVREVLLERSGDNE